MVTGKILYAEEDGTYVLKFVGDVRVTLCTAFDSFLDTLFDKRSLKSVMVDLTETEGIDSTSLGLLAKLSIQAKKKLGGVPTLVSTNDDITRIVHSMGFDQVFDILSEPLEACMSLDELPEKVEADDRVCGRVLEAHKVLMSLNASNQEAFKDLVSTLELQPH